MVYNASATIACKSVFLKDELSGRLTLKPSHSLHLYINVTPQGDARVRAPPAPPSETAHLRYYVVNGSSVPCMNAPPVTMDTLMHVGPTGIIGEPVRVMSASDKIMRWTQLGVQVVSYSKLVF